MPGFICDDAHTAMEPQGLDEIVEKDRKVGRAKHELVAEDVHCKSGGEQKYRHASVRREVEVSVVKFRQSVRLESSGMMLVKFMPPRANNAEMKCGQGEDLVH